MLKRTLSRIFKSEATSVKTLDFSEKHVKTRDGIAIGAIVKNEERYIREWLKFHEHAGVSTFFIYDDGSTDNTVSVAQSSCRSAKIHVFPWRQRLRSDAANIAISNQILAYGHCLSNFADQFRWMAFIDVDEYLVPVSNDTLGQALTSLSHAPLIVLPWVMFGTSGHKTRPSSSTPEAYTQRLDPSAPEGVRGLFNVKCIFDPCAVTRLHVHRMRVNGSRFAWNDAGEKFLFSSSLTKSKLTASNIQLNHYYSRSLEDVEDKITKGRVSNTTSFSNGGDLLRDRINFIDQHSIRDTSIIDYLNRRPFQEA